MTDIHNVLSIWLLSNKGDTIINKWFIDIAKVLLRSGNPIKHSELKEKILNRLELYIIDSGILPIYVASDKEKLALISLHIFNGIYIYIAECIKTISSAISSKSSNKKQSTSTGFNALELPFKWSPENNDNVLFLVYLYWFIASSIKTAINSIELKHAKAENKKKPKKESKKSSSSSSKKVSIHSKWADQSQCQCSDDFDGICKTQGIILGLGIDSYIDIKNSTEHSLSYGKKLKERYGLKSLPVHCFKCITLLHSKEIATANKRGDNVTLCYKCRDYAIGWDKECGHDTAMPYVDIIARSFTIRCCDCERDDDEEENDNYSDDNTDSSSSSDNDDEEEE